MSTESEKNQAVGCIIVAFMLAGAFLWFLVSSACDYTTSEGMRIGSLSKFSRKGIIFKTHEGELVMGGLVANDTGANVWEFSLDHSSADETKLAEKLNALADKGGKVKLKYREVLNVFPWRANTKHLVISADLVGEAEKAK